MTEDYVPPADEMELDFLLRQAEILAPDVALMRNTYEPIIKKLLQNEVREIHQSSPRLAYDYLASLTEDVLHHKGLGQTEGLMHFHYD